MSQEDQILAHLESGATLTPLEALVKFHCLRLGARILALRKAGKNIVTETQELANHKRVARYRLVRPMFQEKLL